MGRRRRNLECESRKQISKKRRRMLYSIGSAGMDQVEEEDITNRSLDSRCNMRETLSTKCLMRSVPKESMAYKIDAGHKSLRESFEEGVF